MVLKFVECIDCRSVRDGNGWIIDFLKRMKPEEIVIDGQAGQTNPAKELKENHVKNVLLPTVKEVINAAGAFEQAIFSRDICHMYNNKQIRILKIQSYFNVGMI